MRERDESASGRADAGASAPEATTEVLWGVGAVARRLGVVTPTLRTWERRYGLGPSARTGGGHRRYSELDVGRVATMSQLIADGVPPARAALVALNSARGPGAMLDRAAVRAVEGVAPNGHDGGPAPIRALLRAARELDAPTLSTIVAEVLDRRGVLAGWTDVVAPFLVAVGEQWASGSLGVDGEHVASECVDNELRQRVRYRHGRRGPAGAPVLLASAADDRHTLPLVALAAALAERHIGTRMLGGCTPADALASAVDRLSPRVVFCWSSLDAGGQVPDLDLDERADSALVLLLGGPGWSAVGQRSASRVAVEKVSDLHDAVDRCCDLVA